VARNRIQAYEIENVNDDNTYSCHFFGMVFGGNNNFDMTKKEFGYRPATKKEQLLKILAPYRDKTLSFEIGRAHV